MRQVRINQNISALNAYRNLTITNNALSKSMEKLSSGFRINRAADDAAGLAISEKMRGQIRGLNQAVRNAQDGISLIQTAEGALNETHSILQRMRELAVQAANDTNTLEDRREIQKEVNQLIEEIDRIGKTTQFNTKVLLSGGFATSGLKFLIGANSGQNIELKIKSMMASALGDTSTGGTVIEDLSVSSVDSASTGGILTQTAAENAITVIDKAIGQVSSERSKLGSVQNRLEHTIANLSVASENLAAAESRIRDLDMAQEMMAFTRNQILSQAGTAMLAQANQMPATVLQLLQ